MKQVLTVYKGNRSFGCGVIEHLQRLKKITPSEVLGRRSTGSKCNFSIRPAQKKCQIDFGSSIGGPGRPCFKSTLERNPDQLPFRASPAIQCGTWLNAAGELSPVIRSLDCCGAALRWQRASDNKTVHFDFSASAGISFAIETPKARESFSMFNSEIFRSPRSTLLT